MIMVVAAMAISANAQVYVGGGFGIGSTSIDGGDDETTYKFVPEIGYSFDKEWAVGAAFGWEGSKSGDKVVSVNPYVRWTFLHTNMVNVFVDGTVGYAHYYGNGNDTDAFQFGLKPGVAVNLNKNLSFVAHVGFLGYEHAKNNNNDVKADSWGLDLDGRNMVFGLYYNF